MNTLKPVIYLKMKFISKLKIFHFLLLLIILIRVFFYLFFDAMPFIGFDSFSYLGISLEMDNGNLPNFGIRTPIYPLLLHFLNLSKNISLIPVFQSLFTVLSFTFCYRLLSKNKSKLTNYFMLAYTIFCLSPFWLTYEFSILTECIFINIQILLTASFILNIEKQKYYVLSSSLTIILFLIRPVGIYTFIIISILAIILFRDNKKSSLKLITPIFLGCIFLASYNFSTIGKFSITPFSGINTLGVVMCLIKESDKKLFNDEHIQNSLKNVTQLKNDNKWYSVNKIVTNYCHQYHEGQAKVGPSLWRFHKKTNDDPYIILPKVIDDVKLISNIVITKNMFNYIKFIIYNFINHFYNITSQRGVYSYDILSQRKDYLSWKSYNYHYDWMDKRIVNQLGGIKKELIDKTMKSKIELIYWEKGHKVMLVIEKLMNFLTNNILWFILLLAAIFKVISNVIRKKKLIPQLVSVILVLFIFGNGSLVSLLEPTLDRYSMTTFFHCYLLIFICFDEYFIKLKSKLSNFNKILR